MQSIFHLIYHLILSRTFQEEYYYFILIFIDEETELQ